MPDDTPRKLSLNLSPLNVEMEGHRDGSSEVGTITDYEVIIEELDGLRHYGSVHIDNGRIVNGSGYPAEIEVLSFPATLSGWEDHDGPAIPIRIDNCTWITYLTPEQANALNVGTGHE